MQFNNIINFSNAKIFSKQIKYNGLDSLNFVHNLNKDYLCEYLDCEYEADLMFNNKCITSKEIEKAAIFEKKDNIDNNLSEQFQKLKELSKKNKFDSLFNNKTEKSFKLKVSIPSDQSSRLLRRLINATGQFEITQVLSSANRALTTMRMCIASCDNMQQIGNLRRAIKKLEKIINRCEIKSKNLKDEEEIRNKAKKAEKNKQHDLFFKINNELKERIRKRKLNENGWLKELSYGTLNKKYSSKRNNYYREEEKVALMNEMELNLPDEVVCHVKSESEINDRECAEIDDAIENISDSIIAELEPIINEADF